MYISNNRIVYMTQHATAWWKVEGESYICQLPQSINMHKTVYFSCGQEYRKCINTKLPEFNKINS